MRNWLLYAAVVGFVIYMGFKDLKLVLSERHITTMSCADYIATRPAKQWVQLFDCEYDLSALAYTQKNGGSYEVKELLIPLRPIGTQGGTTHIVLRRSDDDSREVGEAARLGTTPPADALAHLQRDSNNMARGLIHRGRDDAQGDDLVKLEGLSLAGDFMILEHEQGPSLLGALGGLLLGLLGIGYAVFRWVRHRRGNRAPVVATTPAPAPDDVDDPLEE